MNLTVLLLLLEGLLLGHIFFSEFLNLPIAYFPMVVTTLLLVVPHDGVETLTLKKENWKESQIMYQISRDRN